MGVIDTINKDKLKLTVVTKKKPVSITVIYNEKKIIHKLFNGLNKSICLFLKIVQKTLKN